MQSLPPATQAGVANLVADHGAGAREHLAYQATGEWTAGEREALRTLAAATPNVRAEAISGVLDSSDEHATAQSDPTSATSTQEQSTSGDAGAASGTGAPPAEHEHVTLGELGAPVSGGDPIEQPPVENGGGSNGGQTGSQPGNGGTAGGGTPSSAPNPVEQPGRARHGGPWLGRRWRHAQQRAESGRAARSARHGGPWLSRWRHARQLAESGRAARLREARLGFRPAERWARGRWRAAGA